MGGITNLCTMVNWGNQGIAYAKPLVPNSGNVKGRRRREPSSDRVGQVALPVGFLVHLSNNIWRRHPGGGEDSVWPQIHGSHAELPPAVGRQRAHGVVPVCLHAEPVLRRNREEPQHVATGERGHERLLGIHSPGVRIGHRYSFG